MRKKFTMLLTLLLCAFSSSVMAQPVQGQKYRIKNNVTGLYLQFTSTDKDGVRIKNLGDDNQNQCFYFIPVAEKANTYQIKSESERYLQLTASKQWDMVATDVRPTDDKGDITLVSTGEANKYYLQTVSTCSWGNNIALNDKDAGNDGAIVYADKAKTAKYVVWTLEEFVEAVSFNIEYQIDGETVKTISLNAFSGDTYTIANPSPFTNITSVKCNDEVINDVEGVYSFTVSGNENVVVDLATTLPFNVSPNANSLKWYKVFMASGAKTWGYDVDNNNVNVSDGDPAEWTSAYMFAFVGDPLNGFKIFNKEAGSDKVLWTTNQINGTGTQIVATLLTGVTGDNWILEQGGDGYYAFRREGVDNAYMNPQGGKLCYWKSASGKTDANGGHISFVEVTNEELVALAEVDFNAIFAKASGINAGIGTGVGQYTVTANFATVYAAAEAISKEETPDAAEMEAATTALKAAVEAATLNLPEEGKFYVIQSAATNDYCKEALIYAEDDNRAYWSKGYTTDSYPVSAVWQFEYEDGVCYLKNVHTAEYFNNGAAYTAFLLSENKGNVELVALGDAQFNIKTKGNVLHAQQAQNKVVPYSDGKNTPSAWYVKEVESTSINYTLTVGAAGWASLVLGFNVAIPEDENIKVYTVSSTANGYANLSEVKGVLPANTPVLINAPEGECDFVYSDDEPTTVGDNLLQGKPYNTYVEGAAYVLAKKIDKVGLYKAALNKDAEGNTVTENGTHFLNNANKAYLVVEGANAPMFSFNRSEGTTSIEDVELINENVVIYDLTGRRVEKMEKGIYIVNGKKVLVK